MRGLLRPKFTAGGFGPQQIAAGLWRVQGNPGRMNVFLIEDQGELVMYDAGGACMVDQLRTAIAELQMPLREIVLGHGHTDHRGSAPSLGVPVRCHTEEVIDAEGSGGYRYWRFDRLPVKDRLLHRELAHPYFWDGGPVKISGTIEEGDEVAGFRALHLPGHAPGLIGLIRDSDGIALTSDAFYAIDNNAHDDTPHTPLDAYNQSTEQARESIRKLAAEEGLTVCWPGHGEAVSGDLKTTLLAAANL